MNDLLEKFKDKLPKDYIVAILDMAEKHTNRRFLNDSDVHAQLLIESMIGQAQELTEVRIYSGSLKPECYESVLQNTDSKHIRILVDDFDSAKRVFDNLPNTGNIEILPVAEKQENHFYTVGEASFRFELDHGKATAVANFNEPETVAKLNLRFDAMWDEARKHIDISVEKNGIAAVADIATPA